ncbi:hypothetical protein BO94DRAFT_47536 [Aspergillus sclerotioniger CBS 115572]|uniref:Uncharacterized protein n=1 Tax=Aspergillus sclerotioniger CBS 115572 TaxID=1450535 RepID=A0A317WQB9_9EURO|nr:hypothetical protein BO94DRAFT_47536 [Aspergillus sclerotioniger CBS 115572]PWY88684.1 hypothetical protein BO94DRAFT_47536 [Aspergillus sclerotioniger CBS 115572]
MFRLFLTPFLLQASDLLTHGNPKVAWFQKKKREKRKNSISKKSKVTGKSKSQVLQQHHRQKISKATQERKREKTRHIVSKKRPETGLKTLSTELTPQCHHYFLSSLSSEWNLMYQQRLKKDHCVAAALHIQHKALREIAFRFSIRNRSITQWQSSPQVPGGQILRLRRDLDMRPSAMYRGGTYQWKTTNEKPIFLF